MTKQEHQALIVDMRPYILTALKLKYGDECASCLMPYKSYDIDHKNYKDNLTIDDLQLLCYNCHKDKTMASGEAYLSHCNTCTCY